MALDHVGDRRLEHRLQGLGVVGEHLFENEPDL
jgi:hypothetical protein